MNHPLDGARLKVIRAQEHLDSLKTEVGMFLKEHPYGGVRPQEDEKHGRAISHIIEAPPLRLSTLIGDCVTNTRAALDYIVWQLATKYFASLNPDSHRWVNFPISNVPPDGWIERETNRLTQHGIPTPAIDCIKTVQPYNAGYEPMGWLNALVNTDKHRMPLLTISEMSNSEAARMNYGISEIVRRMAMGYGVHHFKTYGEAVIDAAVQVQPEPTIFVAFEDVLMPHVPVDRTLEQIVETVANVIPRFDRFFV